MIRKSFAVAAAVSLIAANAAFAAAPSDTVSYSLQISGFVPTICHAQLSSTQAPATSGQVDLGQMNEFCNDGNGFEVWVDYSPDMAGDTIQVGGQSYQLDASGSVKIDSSTGPSIASKDVTLDSNGASGSLSFRVVSL